MGKRVAARGSRAGVSSSSARPNDLHGAGPDSPPFAAAGRVRRAVRLHTATALAGGLFAMFAFAGPAYAQSGQGGAGGNGQIGAGGAGGASNPGGPGGAGQNGTDHGGGGGGSGVTGGRGGDAGTGARGGNGGTAPGENGGDAVVEFAGGGGGGGGAAGVVFALDVGTSDASGVGGNGGLGGEAFLAGGGGGAGGAGGINTDATSFGDGRVTGSFTGGNGGNGGNSFTGSGAAGGNGGNGGAGLVFTNAGGDSLSPLRLSGVIQGGNGGSGGTGAINGLAGLGGAGIEGLTLHLALQNSVSGGLSGDGTTRAYAIHFTGGGNTLRFDTGWSLTGGIGLDAGSLQFNILDGDTVTLTNEISGAGFFQKFGAGSLVLAANNSGVTGNWEVFGGTLQIGNGGTTGGIGSGTINAVTHPEFGFSTLTFNRSDDFTFANEITGFARFRKLGNNTLTIDRANSQLFGYVLELEAGTLAIANSDALGFGFGAPTNFGGGSLRTDISTTLYSSFNWDQDSTGALSAAAGTTLSLFHSMNLTGVGATARLGTATDTGTIDANFGIPVGTDGAANQRIIIGGGTVLARKSLSAALGVIDTVQIDAGATLELAPTVGGERVDTTINNLVGGGRLFNEANIFGTATTIIRAGDFSGTLEGAQSVTKTGPGTLILSGANSYTGNTTIDPGGTLQIGDGGTSGTLGSGAVVFNDTATDIYDYPDAVLAFNRSDTHTVGNVISGFGLLRQEGSGTLILTGANTFTGVTELANGTLELGTLDGSNLIGLGSSRAEFTGGTLRAATTGSLGNHLYWNDGGTGAVAAAAGTELTLTGTLNSFGDSTVQFGTATDTGTILANFFSGSSSSYGSQTLVIGGGTLRAANGFMSLAINSFETVQIDSGATLDINGVQATTTINTLQGGGTLLNDGVITMIGAGDFAGTIGGSQTLFKVGGGTLRLTGTNTYSGATTVAGGTLQLGNVGAVGANTLTLSNGGLVVDDSGALGNTLVTAAGTSNVVAAATSTTLTLIGTYNFGAGSTLRVGNAANAGTVRFSFSGGSFDPSLQLFVDAGTLMASNDGLSAITQSIARTEIAAGATLDFNGQVDINGRGGRILNLQGAGRLLNDGESTYLLAGNFAGQIDGSQSIFKVGAGTLILSGANSYTGTTTIQAGTLQIGDGTTFGTLGSGNVTNNGVLAFWGGDLQTLTVANTIGGGGALNVLGGTVVLTGNNSLAGALTVAGGTLALTGSNSFTGGITVAGGTLSLGSNNAAGGAGGMITTTGSVVDYADGIDNPTPITIASDTTQLQVLTGAATQSGVIGEDQPGRGFEKIGAGTLILTGSNSYSGDTLVTGGFINFATDDNLGLGNVTLDGGGLQWRSGTSLDISARLNAIGDDGGTFDTNGSDVTLASAFSGTGGITKTGAGTLTLSAVNGYLGGTTIDQGTLLLQQADSAGTGAITIAADTILQLGSSALDPFGFSTLFDNALVSQGSGASAAVIQTGLPAVYLNSELSGDDFAFRTAVPGSPTAVVLTYIPGPEPVAYRNYSNTFIGADVTLQVVESYLLGTGTVTVEAGGTLELQGIVDVFDRSLAGAGDLKISGFVSVGSANTMTGSTIITGTAYLLADDALTSGQLDMGATSGFFLSGFTQTVASVTGAAGAIIGSYAPGLVPPTSTLTIAGTGADAVYAGEFRDSGGFPGSLALVKNGANSQTFTGASTYSGGTTLNDGTLVAGSSSAFGTGTFEQTGGTLLIDPGVTLALADFVQTGGTFDLNGESASVASLSGSGGSVTDGGTLTVTGGTTTFGGQIFDGLGTTALALGTGVDLTLAGDNAFTGGLTVTDATLRLGHDNAAGGGGNVIETQGTLAVIGYGDGINNASGLLLGATETQLSVALGESAEQSGDITDVATGTLTKTGGGTLTLSGLNSYVSNTSILGGTLAVDEFALGLTQLVEIGNGATLRALADFVIGDARILPSGGTIDTGAFSIDVFGGTDFQGLLTKTGTGTLTLLDILGSGTGTGGVDVAEGTLGLGADTAAGTGRIFLSDGTRLLNVVCSCSTLTIGNNIEIATGGAATIDTDGYETLITGPITGGDAIFADTFGGGLIVLTGTNTYGATTIESSAEVQVGDGGTDGTLGTGNVLNDGVLVFDRSDEITVSQEISGAGLLVQAGTGTLTLTGTNTYTGGTVIDAGTLRVGDGGTTGTLGTGDIENYGALVFNRSDDLTVSDDIFGFGSLTKFNQGTLTLSGFNDYTGTTSVFGGTLAVSGGALFGTSLIEIDSGATLRASGFMGTGANITILEGGGTIDSGPKLFDVFGGVSFGGLLTKTGSGTLLIEDSAETGSGYGGINVIAGTLALGSDTAAGAGLISLADGTTLANATCFCGELTLDNDIAIAQPGTATIDGQGNLTNLNGVISGGNVHFISTSESVESGGSIFNLNGANMYGDTIIGPNVAVILVDGTLGTGNTVFEDLPSNPMTPSALVFANTANYTYEGAISGAGIVSIEADPDVTITLAGSNSSANPFTGTAFLTSGHLVINGEFGDIDGGTASLFVAGCNCDDATLGGNGTFYGDVEIVSGTLAAGNSPGTLNVSGNLTLGAGTILNFEIGESGTVGGASNDRVTVGGNLTLDGTLNVISWPPNYGPGYYRLFDYAGTLTDNTLDSGTIAGGLSTQLLTNINGQVNLRLGPQVDLYWDGTDTTGASLVTGGNGGDGTWNAATTNWTAASGFGINDQWRSVVGVFAGPAAGTVTVEGTQAFEGLRFETDGYLLQPFDATARLNTTGAASTVDVGDGIAADIGVIIQGGAGLTKTGTGTLLLSAVNTYGGATTVSAGTLRLGINNATNNQSALVVDAGATFDLAGFQTQVGSIAGAGAVTLSNGRLDTGYDNTSTTFSGTVTGPDGGVSVFTKNGNGTLTLSGSIALGNSAGVLNSFGQINAGTLEITSTGSISGDLLQNFSTINNSGTITPFVIFQTFGTVTNNATGTIGGTTQNFGTFDNNGGTMGSLQSLGGTATNSGTINGTVQTFTSFTSTGIINGSLSNFATALVEGEVNGEVGNLQVGATVTLTGITTGITNYQGVAGSTLDLANFSTTVGALNGDGSILIGTGTLTIDSQRPFADFGGVISGSGPLVKTGDGEQVLGGVNTYTGLTTVSGGKLTIGAAGSLVGDVQNSAGFSNAGTVAGALTNVGTADNAGTIAGGVANSGTFASTGTIGTGVVNYASGAMSASGQINGSFQNSGTLTLTGALTGITAFNQQPLGQLDLSAYDLTTDSFSGAGSVILGGGLLTTGADNLSTTFTGVISGNGGLTKLGTGELTLSGANTYVGTTTISDGTLRITADGSLGTGGIVDNGTLVLEHNGVITVNGVLTGSGSVIKTGAGSLEFAGNNTPGNDFTGTIQVSNGLLILNGLVGDTAANTAQLTMDAGTQLRGSGTFYGSAVVNGAIGAGNSPGTLTIAGNLTLGGSSILDYEFGASGTPGGADNDLVVVGGNLTLDGTLNTLPSGPGYQAGYYRLFDYGGTLTDNGLTIGSISGGLSANILTNIAGQVNVVLGPQLVQYWDGGDMTGASAAVSGDGGSGTWSAANTNWTAPAGFGINDQWRSSIGVFVGAAGGTVNVVGTQAFQELRFQTDGYVLTGGSGDRLATTAGFSVVQVDSGLAADIGIVISGTAGLTKTGAGALTLSGVNSYTGTTTVSAGTLVNTGTLVGPVVNLASFVSTGTITGMPAAGLFTNSGTAWLEGTVQGDITNLAGTVTFTGATDGIRVFSQSAGAATIIGATPISFAALDGDGTIDLGADLSVGAFGLSTVFAGTISGTGGLTKVGSGTLTLSGVNSYTGTTTVSQGALTNLGTLAGPVVNTANFNNQGIVGGDVYNSASGVFASTGTINGNLDNYGSTSLAGQFNGRISNQGYIFLTGTTTGIGVVNQRLGTGVFDLNGFDTSFGSLTGDGVVRLGGALLTVGGDNSSSQFNGVISGAGDVTKIGTGVLWLNGANTYTGLTTISEGFLALTTNGVLAGGVQNDAEFENEGFVAGLLTNTAEARNEGTLNGGAVNSGILFTLGTINGNVVNSGTVYAEGALNGAVVNDSYFQLTGSLTGVTDFTQGADGTLILDGQTFAVGSLNGTGYVELDGGLLEIGSSGANSRFDGEIYTDGALTKVGAGTLTLTGFNSYRGLTTVSAGTLSNTGTLSGPVLNQAIFTSTGVINGNLDNRFGGSVALRGQLNGAIENYGAITLTGTTTGIGELFLSDWATFNLNGFDTTVGSIFGPGSIQLGSATLTTGSNNLSTWVSGVISGSGGLTKVGTGDLILAGANTYTGLTTISAGGIYIDATGALAGAVRNDAAFSNRGSVAGLLTNSGNATNLGSLNGGVVNSGTLDTAGTINGSLVNSGTVNARGAINGTVTNSGRLTLTGATTGIGAFSQTAAGTFALTGFNTTVGNLAGAGSVQLGNATLTTNGDNSSTAFAGTISGSGALIKVGTGTLVLSGANTFTGPTTITGGTLQLGAGGTGGSLASSSIVDDGVLVINRSDLLQLSAVISGSGSLVQAGAGTTQLTGANTYTGGTLVSAGRLVGNTTSLHGAIQNDATLEFAQAAAGVYAGSLSGTGAFEKTGAGMLNLTGDSSTFTGATRVLGGQLAVNGLLNRSVVTVGPGATLLGVGPIGGLVAQSGSFVAPGNSIGTLQVNGNVQLLAGSTYQAEITPAAADLINATGTAQVAGTLSVINLGGTYTLGTSYVILNAAGGRTGTFDAATGLNSFGTKLRARVVYTPTQVQLLMVQNLLADIACSAPTRNQASFMAGFDNAVQNGGYDPQSLNALYNLDPAGLCRAVNQLSGGVYPAAASAALEEERLIREAAIDRLRFTQDGETVGTGVWGQLVGAWGHVNSDGTGFDVDNNREGVIFGVDTGGEGWRVGLYGHHIETEVDADALASEAHIDRNGLGAYAGFGSGSFRARVGASYSDLELSTTRAIAFPGFSASASGKGDGSMVQGFGELAYRFDIGNETFLEPFADLALAKVDLDAINETGSATAQLRVAEQEHDIGRAILGLRGDAAVQSGSTRLRVGIDAGLQHNFGDRSVAALIALDAAPQYPFTVRAAELEPWGFVGGGRVAIDFGSNVTATIAYRGVLAGNRNDHAASGTLSVKF